MKPSTEKCSNEDRKLPSVEELAKAQKAWRDELEEMKKRKSGHLAKELFGEDKEAEMDKNLLEKKNPGTAREESCADPKKALPFNPFPFEDFFSKQSK